SCSSRLLIRTAGECAPLLAHADRACGAAGATGASGGPGRELVAGQRGCWRLGHARSGRQPAARDDSVAGGRSGRDQVLHLLGRNPLLTVRQLADLLGTPGARIEQFERALMELDWLR